MKRTKRKTKRGARKNPRKKKLYGAAKTAHAKKVARKRAALKRRGTRANPKRGKKRVARRNPSKRRGVKRSSARRNPTKRRSLRRNTAKRTPSRRSKSRYLVTNTVSGVILGVYRANSKDDALDAMARDAGYANQADALDVIGSDGSDLKVTLLEKGRRAPRFNPTKRTRIKSRTRRNPNSALTALKNKVSSLDGRLARVEKKVSAVKRMGQIMAGK